MRLAEKGELKNRIYIMSKGKRLEPFFYCMLSLFKNVSRIRTDISHTQTKYEESSLRILLLFVPQATSNYFISVREIIRKGRVHPVKNRKSKTKQNTNNSEEVMSHTSNISHGCLFS